MLRQVWAHRADYLYVLPAIVVMLIVIAYPIYYTIELSFFKTPPGLQLRDKIFVGFDNYTAILTSDVFWRVTANTFIWTLSSTVISFVLGFAAALALHREFVGRGVLRAILIIPWVISAVAASYIWKWIYHSDFGVIGAVLVGLGTGRPAAEFHRQRQHGPALADRGQHLARVSVRHDHDDGRPADGARSAAARREGRRRQRVAALLARHVPASAGVSTVTILLLAVANFNSFIIPWIMTGGGPSNASHIWITHIYELAFGRQRWGVASAYSVLLFLILMTLGYFYVRALSGSETKGARRMSIDADTAVAARHAASASTAGGGPGASSSCSCCSTPPCR